MSIWLELVLQSIALGVALAMDAFSVSMANGLSDPGMARKKMFVIAGTFAGFQFAMPMIGWFCVTTIKEIFSMFEKFIPWLALLLLLCIGGKMLFDGVRGGVEADSTAQLSVKLLALQGIATSIDALSTGFTTASYSAFQAFLSSLIIAVVTLFICIAGVKIGKKFGVKLAGRAQMLGGVILILIGLKICFVG